MQLSQVRDLALKLINSFSADGEILPLTDTADFRLAFNDFLNTAQNKWTEKDKIGDVLSVVQDGSEPLTTPYNVYPLPDGYIGMDRVTFQQSEGRITPFSDYLVTKGNIYVDYTYEGNFEFYYFKRPTILALDTDVPQIDPRHHNYLAYYCAGEWLFSSGKQSEGIVLLNRFDAFLQEMRPSIVGSSTTIENTNGW